jgi:CRP/FNR family transcriptional regulator, cyclic AMP receptor protein
MEAIGILWYSSLKMSASEKKDRVEYSTAKLAAAAAFDGVAPTDLAALLGQTRIRDYRNREHIFSRGDPGDQAFLVVGGFVQIGTLGENGKRVVVEIFKEQELFGEVAVIDGLPRTADATAMGGAKLAVLPAAAFRGLLQASPAFAVNVLRLANTRLRRTYSLFEDASLSDLEHRLAKQVLYLMGLGSAGGRRVRIYARLHQKDLADLLGATPRSIINILKKWRKDGLVDFDGRTAQLTILDTERFNALSDSDVLRIAK